MANENESIEAMPTKAFFVNMLVRDIPLERAVLDLLDNCIDGAKNVRPGDEADYSGLFVKIEMNGERFTIEDNCGGFDITQARRYAFRFGRPDGADATAYSIGQFGVGMKRALFKFGKFIEVRSTTRDQHWSMHIDVDDWLTRENEWTFVFDEVNDEGVFGEEERGTKIEVRDLRPEVSARFESEFFKRKLADMIRSHQRKFLALGLGVEFDGRELTASELSVRAGGTFQPAIEELVFEPDSPAPLKVRLVVGVSDPSPRNAGWYVLCNRRVIVAADRSDDTGWGTVTELKDGLPKYNNHFARFRGVVSFDCQDSGKMPWNTTKTGLDDSTVVWQKAYEKMRDHARSVVSFLNALANEIGEYGSDASPMLTALERETRVMDVGEFTETESRFRWNEDPPEVGPKMKIIQYRREEEKIEMLKEVFGVTSQKAVGEKSFDLAYALHLEDG